MTMECIGTKMVGSKILTDTQLLCFTLCLGKPADAGLVNTICTLLRLLGLNELGAEHLQEFNAYKPVHERVRRGPLVWHVTCAGVTVADLWLLCRG